MVMRHIILILALLCASCSSGLPSIKPYKMDIQQGNVVTSKMLLQLRPGMNRSQVRFIMGTPLIQDSFHKNRWDYFYQMRKGGKIIEQRRVILEFEDEALKRVRGDVIPAGSGQELAEPAPVTESGKAPAKEPEKKKGLMDKLKFWKGDDKDAEKSQMAPAELVSPQTKESASPKQAAPAPVKPTPEAVPAPAMESTPEEKPVPMPAEPTQSPEPKPTEPAKPAAEQAPLKPVAPTKAPTPAAEPAIAPKETAKPQTAPEPAAEPDKDLPPEDEPGYFERMLEKIGF